jgi:hypothetical protein
VTSIFNNDHPSVEDRLNCFPPDFIEMVHSHNLIKQADYKLQVQISLNEFSHKNKMQLAAPISAHQPRACVVWSPQQAQIITAVRTYID